MPHWADTDAATTADAAGQLPFVLIYLELAGEAVAPAFRLPLAGVVTRGVEGEVVELTAVPVLLAFALAQLALVDDVEAVAGRAGEGAGSAGEAVCHELCPLIGVVVGVVIEPALDRHRHIAVEVGAKSVVGGLHRCVSLTPLRCWREKALVLAQKLLALRGGGLYVVAAIGERSEQQVGAIGAVGLATSSGAEAGSVGLCAGDGDDRRYRPPPEVEVVLVVHGEDGVEAVLPPSITGACADDHRLRVAFRQAVVDRHALGVVGEVDQHFGLREEELLHRVMGDEVLRRELLRRAKLGKEYPDALLLWGDDPLVVVLQGGDQIAQ